MAAGDPDGRPAGNPHGPPPEEASSSRFSTNDTALLGLFPGTALVSARHCHSFAESPGWRSSYSFGHPETRRAGVNLHRFVWVKLKREPPTVLPSEVLRDSCSFDFRKPRNALSLCVNSAPDHAPTRSPLFGSRPRKRKFLQTCGWSRASTVTISRRPTHIAMMRTIFEVNGKPA